jgi:hypothetical protein
MFGLLETVLGGAAAGVGFALGVGATVAGSHALRPLAREAVRGAMAVTDRARQMTAGLAESMEDVVAEARAEREAERAGVGCEEKVTGTQTRATAAETAAGSASEG